MQRAPWRIAAAFSPRLVKPPLRLVWTPSIIPAYPVASKELGRTGYYFVLAFSLTFIFMYIVLAAQFESFIHPITILSPAPRHSVRHRVAAGHQSNGQYLLGARFAAALRHRQEKRHPTDRSHQWFARRGLPRYEAILQANRDRLRPILMTTIALVAGMLPLVISSGIGAATNRSIGVLVVGGQSLCLILTLLAVPVFYSFFEDVSQWPALQKLGKLIGGIRRLLPVRKAVAVQPVASGDAA